MSLHLALTGGIGTGKSTAAKMLVARGAHLIDADVLARQVVEPDTPALEQIAATFGNGVLTAMGELDRAALAQIVFASETQRERLNAIVHPAVRDAAAQRRREIINSDTRAVVLEDIPLLSDPADAARFHAVIVIHTPFERRIQRLVDRGMGEADARARIAAQVTDAQRFLIADARLANDGTLDHLERQVDLLWRDRLVPFRDGLHGEVAPPAPRAGTPIELARAHARVRHAFQDHGLQAEISSTGGVMRVIKARGGIAEALHAAGFVRTGGATFVSADPGAPIELVLG